MLKRTNLVRGERKRRKKQPCVNYDSPCLAVIKEPRQRQYIRLLNSCTISLEFRNRLPQQRF
jgi:hypothetical protein